MGFGDVTNTLLLGGVAAMTDRSKRRRVEAKGSAQPECKTDCAEASGAAADVADQTGAKTHAAAGQESARKIDK